MADDIEPRYRCPDCGWIGTEDQMLADCIEPSDPFGDETYSNWICPQCETWWSLNDYERVEH